MPDSPLIAVFGSSEPLPDSPAYRTAQAVGGALAREGWGVITGGYTGVMEAASRGAREAGGKTVIGVCCEIFAHRQPNAFLTETVQTPDLHQRSRELIERADGFVLLDGQSGTVSEAGLLWALDRAGCLGDKPIVAVGGTWADLLRYLSADGWLAPPQAARTATAADSSEVVDRLREGLRLAD